MRIIICDDDITLIQELKEIVINYFNNLSLKIPDIESFTSGEDLLKDKGNKDIVFLDIELPGKSGIQIGNELKKQNKNVIIFVVTSYPEYLDDAMRFHVFRYLSKPLDVQRINRNLKDALELYNTSIIKVPMETKEGITTISATDIICIEAHGRNVTVRTIQNDYNSIHTIKYWDSVLKDIPGFFSSHRSYIVNFKHVTSFDHSLIHLYNNHYDAYLTRRKYTQFKDEYLLYLETTR